MIKHDLNILEQADIEGRSGLMWAAGKGATDVIQTLLALNNPAASVEKKFDEETLGVCLPMTVAVNVINIISRTLEFVPELGFLSY